MFQKYYKNTVKLSCMNKEKTMTAGSCFKKINKVYKKKCKIFITYVLLLIFLKNGQKHNLEQGIIYFTYEMISLRYAYIKES